MLASPRAAWFTFSAMADLTIPNRPALAGALKKAMRQHRAGRLDAAEAGYRRVLTADPGNANANHQLGRILTRSKRLKEAFALLRRATMFVGSDTGPLHLAAAVGTTCVSMYGPTRPSDCGPYGQQHIALQSYYQDGSARERRRAPNDAMRAIDVEQVAEACGRVLGKKEHSAA